MYYFAALFVLAVLPLVGMSQDSWEAEMQQFKLVKKYPKLETGKTGNVSWIDLEKSIVLIPEETRSIYRTELWLDSRNTQKGILYLLSSVALVTTTSVYDINTEEDSNTSILSLGYGLSSLVFSLGLSHLVNARQSRNRARRMLYYNLN
jgi:hypothetical protein